MRRGPHDIGRRVVLRGLGGVAVSLPLVHLPGCTPRREVASASAAQVAATGYPKRFVVFYHANGTHPDRWIPTGGETNFTLSSMLAPLQRHKDKLVILAGMDMPAAEEGLGAGGDGHQRGLPAMLTGRPNIDVDGSYAGAGISLDQSIANAIGNSSPFRSVELGVRHRYNGDLDYERMSYRAAGQHLPPEDDPAKAFTRLFAGVNPDPGGEVDIALEQRRSVLDFVADDYARLVPKLGIDDRARVEGHLESIREIERRLAGSTLGSAGCQVPQSPPAGLDPLAEGNFPEVGRLQMDNLAMALACDLTRVGSLMWSQGRSLQVFSWLGMSQHHHDLSHESQSNTDAAEKIRQINVFYAEQMAYFLDRLAAVPEGDGTLLDNTLVLWCSDLGEGRAHSNTDIPTVLAGGAGGSLPTGRFLTYSGASYNDLFISLHQAMGVDVTSFGDSRFSNGPLSGLL